MRFLVDNNVPRSVTYAIRKRHDATEVRSALGQAAPDSAVAAYAAAEDMIVVTHDRGLARRCRDRHLRHVWLRTHESQDEERVTDAVAEITAAFDAGSIRVTLFRRAIRLD